MSATRTFWIALGIIAALVAVRLIMALDSFIRVAPTAASPGGMPPGRGVALPLILGLVALFLVLVAGVGLMLFDLGGRREEEAERLGVLISRALGRELGPLAVLPTAHVPRSRSAPVIVELTGTVPSAEVRDAVVQVVERELARLRPSYRIEDRLGVDEAVTPAA